MNKSELKTAVRSLGWTLISRKIGNRMYFYGVKRIERRRVERYLFPALKLRDMQQADVWDRLLNAPTPKQQTDQVDQVTLATCPYCGHEHPVQFIEWCPLKPTE